MKKIKDIGQKKQGARNYLFALFFCPICQKSVEKIKKDGEQAKSCSRNCYSADRHGKKRGAYKDFIISSGYRYRYDPKHPLAIGTRKLYVAEHRLIMESMLGRYLTNMEVVHHKNENTLDNSPENLELMSKSAHDKYHSKNRKRDKNGKFTV